MAPRTALLLTVALLAPLATSASAAPGLGVEEPDLSCGELSPFDRSCEDCCARYPGGTPTVVLAVLGFVGQVDVRLVGDDGSMRWRCWVLGARLDGVTSACTGPWETGDGLRRNEWVELRCTANPTTGPGLPAPVDPYGPYGCNVYF